MEANKIEQIKKFIGVKAVFNEDTAGYIFGVDTDNNMQMIGEVRGWGAIQNLFPGDIETAQEFQDDLGLFIAEAITEKINKP